jgi:hypothetical protein
MSISPVTNMPKNYYFIKSNSQHVPYMNWIEFFTNKNTKQL